MVSQISNGESGLSVRTKLNAALAGTVPADIETKTGFWTDVDATPIMWRIRDRVAIGDAATIGTTRHTFDCSATWLVSGSNGPSWLLRDAQVAVMHDKGGVAIVGMTRHSDGATLTGGVAPVGISGFAVSDVDNNGAWAAYFETQIESGTNRGGIGIEIDVKNKSVNAIGTPYGLGYGGHGIWLAGGGDNSYGGVSANPSNSAITILKNSNTWNNGILFSATGITGTDGVTGTGVAIKMAKGHIIEWQSAAGVIGTKITGDVATSGKDVSLSFSDNVASFDNTSSKSMLQINNTTSAVNGISCTAAATGNPVQIGAQGDDSNIDILVSPKGTGVVRVGTFTTLGAETLAGYITIKDSAGTLRKLAVIA